MLRAAVLGATGYVAQELFRLLFSHPDVTVTAAVSASASGQFLDEIYPAFRGFPRLELSSFDADKLKESCDVAFLALPHGTSAPLAAALALRGLPVIDLSADFRYKDLSVYQETYGVVHCCPELAAQGVYGLSELYEDSIKGASLIANPGCYVTCSLLSLIPLAKAGYIEESGIIIDAKSGISGAGNNPKPEHQFARVDGNFKAYSVGTHRHTSEIEEQLSFAFGTDKITVSFTPHLLPVKRGILCTIYARPSQAFGPDAEGEIQGIYKEAYKNKPFIHINPPGVQPELSHVVGSNHFNLGFVADRHTGNLILTSVLDNMIKGAAGQAIQNMNLMFGLDPAKGLIAPAWSI